MKDIISTIKSILPGSTPQRILNGKLGLDKDGVPYYLYLLNLSFGDNEEEIENNFNRFRQLAIDLRKRPKAIKELIISTNWRPTLVGNAVTILLRDSKSQENLIWGLENGSWVSPQLAVGIALLDDGLAETELIRIIENASEKSNPKIIMSAFSSLKFLESQFAKEFEKTDLFQFWKEKDSWDNSVVIAERHWDFWKNIKPIN